MTTVQSRLRFTITSSIFRVPTGSGAGDKQYREDRARALDMGEREWRSIVVELDGEFDSGGSPRLRASGQGVDVDEEERGPAWLTRRVLEMAASTRR